VITSVKVAIRLAALFLLVAAHAASLDVVIYMGKDLLEKDGLYAIPEILMATKSGFTVCSSIL
jgi:urea transporter